VALLIDPPTWPAHGTTWSHLVSDSSLDELHTFARRLGLGRRAFDLDHYDVPAERHAECVAAGARAVSGRELIVRLRASGLRVPAHERGAAKAAALLARWDVLLPGVPGARAVGEDLVERWHEPHRVYHGPAHLVHVLDSLAVLEDRPPGVPVPGEPAPSGTSLRAQLALWFHDAVHEGVAGEDEESSARLAVSCLSPLVTGPTAPPTPGSPPAGAGLTSDDVVEVARLVRLTATHDPAPDDEAGALVSDADLAILGSTPDRYARYVRQVRAEYAHVPDEQFVAGRAAVLDQLLAPPALFRTEAGRARWQDRATQNLQAERSDLTTRGAPAHPAPRR
jgi:predicted metal-dependent HD superfamily phosphohydrolase